MSCLDPPPILGGRFESSPVFSSQWSYDSRSYSLNLRSGQKSSRSPTHMERYPRANPSLRSNRRARRFRATHLKQPFIVQNVRSHLKALVLLHKNCAKVVFKLNIVPERRRPLQEHGQVAQKHVKMAGALEVDNRIDDCKPAFFAGQGPGSVGDSVQRFQPSPRWGQNALCLAPSDSPAPTRALCSETNGQVHKNFGRGALCPSFGRRRLVPDRSTRAGNNHRTNLEAPR